MNQPLLNKLHREFEALNERVQALTYHLEEEALRHRPHPSSWSALDCLDHLNIYNHYYLKALTRALSGAPASARPARLSWKGRLFVHVMAPKNGKIRYKMKTFKHTEPLPDNQKLARVVLQNFLTDTRDLAALTQTFSNRNWGKSRVNTFLPWLKLNAADALAFVLAHNQRHILQAERALGTK